MIGRRSTSTCSAKASSAWGVNADWEHPYLTFVPNYEAGNVEIFKKMYLDGAIYRGRKPIHWCKRCHTALAEAEIEYSDEVSPSIFVDFLLDEVPAAFSAAGIEGPAYVLIWTTTPWTLPANTAVSLAPEADYCMVRAAGKLHLFAKELVETVAGIAGWDDYEIVRDAAGAEVHVKGQRPCRACLHLPGPSGLEGSHHLRRPRHHGLWYGRCPYRSWPWYGRLPGRAEVRHSDAHARRRQRCLHGPCGTFCGHGHRRSEPAHHRMAARRGGRSSRKRRFPTAIRTAGVAISRSSSVPRTSGSSPWTTLDCARRRSTSSITR